MTTDVAERETQTTSEAEQASASEDQQVTAASESVQPGQENQEQETQQPDPSESRRQALSDAEREEAEQRGRDAALAELQSTQTQQQRDQQRQRVRSTFQTEAQNLDNLLTPVDDGMGNTRNLSPQEIVQRAKNALNNLNKVASQVAEDTVAEQVKNVAYNILPKAAQEVFTGLTTEDTDLPTYLNHWVETAALHTKAVKAMTLEDAEKASTKIKREVAQIRSDEFDKGREQGRLDPPGTSPDGGRSGQRSAPGTKTYAQLEEGYATGLNTRAEDAEYIKLRDARRKG